MRRGFCGACVALWTDPAPPSRPSGRDAWEAASRPKVEKPDVFDLANMVGYDLVRASSGRLLAVKL